MLLLWIVWLFWFGFAVSLAYLVGWVYWLDLAVACVGFLVDVWWVGVTGVCLLRVFGVGACLVVLCLFVGCSVRNLLCLLNDGWCGDCELSVTLLLDW